MSDQQGWSMTQVSATRQHGLTLELIILFAVLTLTAIHYWLHHDFTVDDAAISFSYARNFAEGYGLGALYPGAPRVEGYSNLLWVLLLGAGTWIGLDTIFISKLLGLVFALGCVTMMYLILKDFLVQRWMLFGLALLSFSLPFIFWSVSGLEIALYAFLILLSVNLLLLEQRDPARLPIGSAFSLLLVSMTRPEGLVYAMAGFLYKVIQLALAWRHRDTEAKRSQIKQLLVWIGIFAAGYILFKAWHVWYFAYLWPNPVVAKAGWNSTDLLRIWTQPEGWVYLRGFFRSSGAVYLIPFTILGGLVALSSELRVLVFFSLAALVLPLYTGDWMVNYRFVVPFIPFYIGLLILAADRLWTWSLAGKENPFILRTTALLAGMVFALILARSTWANINLAQSQLECGYQQPWAEARCIGGRNYWTMAEVEQKYAGLIDHAERIGLSDPLYLIPDIGATSYEHNYRIIDLAGLADIHLARADQPQITKQYLFQEQLPDFILTHSIWTRRTDLTALSAIWEQYLPVDISQDPQERVHGTFVRKDLIVDRNQQDEDPVAELAPGLFVNSIDAPPVVHPDTDLAIDIYWSSTADQEKAFQQQLTLVDSSGEVVLVRTGMLGYGWYPTTSWKDGEEIRQHIVLPKDIPPGDYTIEVRALDSMDNPAGSSIARHPLLIDETAARESAQDFLRESRVLRTQGDIFGAISALDMAEKIYPGIEGSDDLRAQFLFDASLQLLSEAKLSYKAGKYEYLIERVKAASGLRGRQQPSLEWIIFGEELKLSADESSRDGDTASAYWLYLAASLADPDSSWTGRNLEVARRLYLDSLQEETG